MENFNREIQSSIERTHHHCLETDIETSIDYLDRMQKTCTFLAKMIRENGSDIARQSLKKCLDGLNEFDVKWQSKSNDSSLCILSLSKILSQIHFPPHTNPEMVADAIEDGLIPTLHECIRSLKTFRENLYPNYL